MMKAVASVLALVSLIPVLGGQASAQKRVPRISLIETGEFHGDEIPARSGERWLGLFPTAGGFALLPATVKVEAVHDMIVDEPQEKTGKKVSVRRSRKPVFLLRGAGGLNRGAVTGVFSGERKLGNGELVGLKLGGNNYRLKVVSGDPAPASHLMPNSKLLLTVGAKTQVIFSVAEHDDGSWTLLWAGDLDGDGRLDLYLDLNDHYNTSQRRLFLSTQASRGQLVKEVAAFSIVGC
jgi:hypothetical protein